MALGFSGWLPTAMAAPQDGQSGCGLTYEWQSNSSGLILGYDSPTGAITSVPMSEPLVLFADAQHQVHKDLECYGCGDAANRFIEMRTNILYRFQTRDGAPNLTQVANESLSYRSSISTQTVFFQANENIPVDMTRTYYVDVYASSLDAAQPVNKPPTFQLQGYYRIEVTRRRSVEMVTLAGGNQVERTRLLNDFVVFTQDAAFGINPGQQDPATECRPTWGWLPGEPIVGYAWAGEAGGEITDLYEQDLITCTAWGVDMDEIELRCEQLDDCAPTKTRTHIGDVLAFSWSATAGTFVGGSGRRTVAYLAPRTPGTQVTITVAISNLGGQATDQALIKTIDFVVQESRKDVTSALISVVYKEDINIPTDADIGHMAVSKKTKMPEAYASNFTWVNPATNKWEILNGLFGTVSYHKHPWEKAIEMFKRSSNPAPPATFANYDAIVDWMKAKDFRHVHLIEATAIVRRDVIQEVIIQDLQNPDANLKYVVDEGWTPTREMTYAAKLSAQLLVTGEPLPDFMRGEFDPDIRKVLLSGEFTAQARLEMRESFRVGNTGNILNRKMTNRLVPWILANLDTYIPATSPVQPSHVVPSGDFPTHFSYLGIGGVINFLQRTTAADAVEFFARGPKDYHKGI